MVLVVVIVSVCVFFSFFHVMKYETGWDQNFMGLNPLERIGSMDRATARLLFLTAASRLPRLFQMEISFCVHKTNTWFPDKLWHGMDMQTLA